MGVSVVQPLTLSKSYLGSVLIFQASPSWMSKKYPPISAATAAGHLDSTRWRRLKHNLKLEPLHPEGAEGEPKNRTPINQWRNTLVTSGRKIEEYVRLYHPIEGERADLANDLRFDQLWLPDHPSDRSDVLHHSTPNENAQQKRNKKSKFKNKGRTPPLPHNPDLNYHYESQLQEEKEDLQPLVGQSTPHLPLGVQNDN
jgi:hypothetical protein